ncbi:helix-turn-helix domain-containing protein [Aureimonas phyllosphaerae]|uniref:helix-turn-helix domain-containing protein n=1 Tax=Aureimonas phyllosphaerae TaxID=1166078 RepID=UPI003A5C5AF6
MIDASQMRAARGLLEWSQTQLAEASNLSLPTIKRMEKLGPGRSSADNVSAVRKALEAAGVIFLDDGAEAAGGPGVRLRRSAD